jgi:D-alanyl-lipoteichoic acid acyltransferase DltB (MBOAT superfamily)
MFAVISEEAVLESRADRIGIVAFGFILAELSLLVIALRQFQIESAALLRLAMLAFAGFAVHAVLPLRYRLPFFTLLSLGGIVLVFGLAQGAWLIGLGVVLIAICHLPIAFGARVLILLGVGGLLAAQRAHWLPAPWSQAVWPILGSMFMFRLIAYLYDLKHEKPAFSPWRVASYFFLLPNVCFPLFPVVDYKAFRRNYFDADTYATYQTGVGWMARGVFHLILYRVVYYYLTVPVAEVKGGFDLAQFIVANFLLYLRVSGQFHFIIGMLCLFGFRLPETHHLYYLASSFTDFWRRINIYWKEFMQKVFYYPAFFRLKRFGTTQALIVSTIFVFFATWLLHAYQWFWLRGSFLLTLPDASFWGILAVLVVLNSMWEIRHGRERRLKKTAPTVGNLAWVGVRTVATFAVIATLWSVWTADSLAAWWGLMSAASGPVALPTRLAPTMLVAVLAVATTPLAVSNARVQWTAFGAPYRSTAITVASLLLMAFIGLPGVYTHLGTGAANFVLSLKSGQLNRVDQAMMDRGYYEDLVRVDRFNSQLWEIYMNRPVAWLHTQGAALDRFTNDFLGKKLVPSVAFTNEYGTMHTNRWGMRDRDYDLTPAPGTHRAALLGASTVMGWGVRDGDTFENLVETRLNGEHAGQPWARYEILNFSVPGYSPLHQLRLLDHALEFQPQAVFYVGNKNEALSAAQYLVEVVRKKVDLPWPYLSDLVRRAQIDARTEESVAMRRLLPFGDELVDWIYKGLVDGARARGAVPVFVYLPWLGEDPALKDAIAVKRRAAAAGFVVVDLAGAFGSEDTKTLRLAVWDTHPNARGHALIAQKFYTELQAHQREIYGASH